MLAFLESEWGGGRMCACVVRLYRDGCVIGKENFLCGRGGGGGVVMVSRCLVRIVL